MCKILFAKKTETLASKCEVFPASNGMRILNLSLDRIMFDANSPVAKRIAALSRAAGEVVVLTPSSYRGGKIAQFFTLWKCAKNILLAKRFDLITVQDTSYLALLAYLLSREFRLPLEVQVHGLEKFYGLRKLIARFVLRRADKIRVVSERLKLSMVNGQWSPVAKMYVLPVYTQIATPTPLAPLGVLPLGKGGEWEKHFTFITVGRLVPVKNIAMQIRAFARIANEFPQARLRVVGNGPLAESLRWKVESEKFGDKVIFEGQQENLARFYEEADAFLLTSNSEGWGVAVTEAAAYGLPIIMTDVGCAGEFIKNEENGLVIPVGDEDVLVFAMRKIITDGELRTRLAAAARRAFETLPTAEEQIQKQITEWRTLL